MNTDATLAKQQELLSKLTHANTKLTGWHFKQEKALANLRRRISRIVASDQEKIAMREQIISLSEKVEELSESVMQLSEMNHNLTSLLHQTVMNRQAQPEAKDNVTHLKRSV